MLWSGSPWQPLVLGQTTSLASSTSGIAKKNKRSLRLAFFHSLVRLPVSRSRACQLGGRVSSCGQRLQASQEPHWEGQGRTAGQAHGSRSRATVTPPRSALPSCGGPCTAHRPPPPLCTPGSAPSSPSTPLPWGLQRGPLPPSTGPTKPPSDRPSMGSAAPRPTVRTPGKSGPAVGRALASLGKEPLRPCTGLLSAERGSRGPMGSPTCLRPPSPGQPREAAGRLLLASCRR